MRRELGIGLVGCGQIAPRHLKAISEVPGLSLKAVCDSDEKRLTEWKARLAVPAYSEYAELLSQSNVDIISICTPNYLHAPMAWAALKAGKHTVVEKPLALSAMEALRLGNAFDRAGLALFTVLQVRFNPAVQAVTRVVESGGLGRMYVASLVQRWNRRSSYFEGENNWHGKKELEGGALFTQGIHYIDLLLQLAGPVDEVSAQVATLAHEIETEDAVAAHVRFRSGAMGVIEFSLDTYEKNLEATVTLLGEKGTVALGGVAANELRIWKVEAQPVPEGVAVAMPNDYGGAYQGSPPNHADIYRNVVAHLLDHAEGIAVRAASAAESIQVIEAIYESAGSNRTIHLRRLDV